MSFYAPDEVIEEVVATRNRIGKWIFCEREVIDDWYAVVREVGSAMMLTNSCLPINGDVYYAIVSSHKPFETVLLPSKKFVILVDGDSFYSFLSFCLRIQSLSPLAEFLDGGGALAEHANLLGIPLLNILKYFLQNPIGATALEGRTRAVYQSALLFIVGHERAHIAHGHMDFIRSEDFACFAKDTEDRDLTLRTLEMDADSSGTTAVYDVFEHILFPLVASKGLDECIAEETAHRFRAQYIAGAFISILFADARLKNFNTPGYPLGYARFLTVSEIMKKVLASLGNKSAALPEQVREQIVDAFAKLNGDVEKLGHPIATNCRVWERSAHTPRHEYNVIGVWDGLRLLQPLYGRWARLRPFLEKYQRGGRLAPASANPF
ncbi:hypothetical protein [Terrarubrum flagellatum]|uniref:hypothetical protein n=1 Tax=Terrirubrum flagellatum TaxID=2895980 RepID=UPI003144FF0A